MPAPTPPPTPPTRATLAAHRPWKQVLCTGAVLLVLLARVPLLWTAGEFVAEDGSVFFAGAWNDAFPGSLLQPYAGYFHLLPRLLAELWSGLPLVAQPYAYAASGLLLGASILSAFYLPCFRAVLPSDGARLVVVAFLAVAPNAENLGLLLGLHWYLAFLLVLLLLAPAPASRAGRLGFVLLATLCIWSSPSTFAVAPLALALALRARDPHERFRLWVVLVQVAIVAALALLLRVSLAERTGEVGGAQLLAALPPLVLRGWIGTALLGPRLAGELAATQPWLLDALGLTALLATSWLLHRHRAARFAPTVALLLGAALLMLLLSLARTAYVAELAAGAMPRHVRYLTAPTLLLYLGLAILLYPAVAPRWRTRAALGAALPFALLGWSLPGQVHWSRAPAWYRLRDFAPAIARFAQDAETTGVPASLYVPADVPYWGPVLQRHGGVVIPPEAGLARVLDARSDGHGGQESWLGRFATEDGGPWIRHEHFGRLEFTGVEVGRVFFRDPAGRLLFTSPLLAPDWWILDGSDWIHVRRGGGEPAAADGPGAGPGK